MTTRTRYFLTGSALIVLLGLGTGLVAYYKRDLPLFKSRVGPEELAYVPADATGLAYANVREIMNSEFRQKLRLVLPTGEGKNELLNQTGIDVEHDISSVVAAAAGKGDPSDHGLFLIRGLFDEGRIETFVRQHEGAVEDYKGKRLLLPGHPGASASSAPGPCLTFAEPGLAMIGTEATVKRAIDTRASHQDVTTNADLMKLVAQLDGAGNTVWAVGGLDAVTSNPNVPAHVKEQLPGIEWVAVSAHVNGGVTGQFRAQAKDDKSATDLRAVVNGAIAAGHMMGGKDPKLDLFLNGLQLSGSGKDVDLGIRPFAGHARHDQRGFRREAPSRGDEETGALTRPSPPKPRPRDSRLVRRYVRSTTALRTAPSSA